MFCDVYWGELYFYSIEMRVYIAILFAFFWSHSKAQPSGIYLMRQDACEMYYTNGEVDIQLVRNVGDILTNYWDAEFESIPLAKRKKAVVRHVKHLVEEIEFRVSSGEKVNRDVCSIINELNFLLESFIHKSWQAQHPEVTFSDKRDMLKATLQSRGKLKYETNNYDVLIDTSGLFWNPVQGKLYKQFGKLADAKKVDTDNPVVIIFDELDHDGSAPKIKAMDTDLDNEWVLKWGDEVHTDVVGSRLFAALGYDVDHPYYFSGNELFLILDDSTGVSTWQALHDSILFIYDVDLKPFYLESFTITKDSTERYKKFKPYIGREVVVFRECALESRPDRVKRLGSFIPEAFYNVNRTELQGALLAHIWIDNWDVREQNTLLTTVHNGNYEYKVSAVFSDLGTSFGVKLSPLSGDFKVGLVNEYGWVAAKKRGSKVKLIGRINAWLDCYEEAGHEDLKWMAEQISQIDSLTLRKCIAKSGWPSAVKELYFHKLASRRASILEAFDIIDPNPIAFDRKLNIMSDGIYEVKNGKLKTRYKEHPESLHGKKGRMRNYGN